MNVYNVLNANTVLAATDAVWPVVRSADVDSSGSPGGVQRVVQVLSWNDRRQ